MLDGHATAVIKLNGTTEMDGTVALAEGLDTITVEATAADRLPMQTYTVTATRNAQGQPGGR